MEKKCTIVLLSMETLISGFPEPARGANLRGGLGILSGDIPRIKIVPLYHNHWINPREEIFYDELAKQILELRPQIRDRRYTVKAREIFQKDGTIYGLECPSVFDVLYTDNRWQRLQQEVLIGKTAPLLLKRLNIKPDILWLNESHTTAIIPSIKEDPYFKETKILFTVHTPETAGMETFPEEWFDELDIDPIKYRPIFVEDGRTDFTRAAVILADGINAVSQEHAQVTRKMFQTIFFEPEYRQKINRIIGIRNGSCRDTWLSQRLREAGENINFQKLWKIHQENKREFLDFIAEKTGVKLNMEKPLMAWVRRIVPYKNQYPMLEPVIRAICAERGEMVEMPFGKLEGLDMQVSCAGRISENDFACQGWIKKFYEWMNDPRLQKKFLYLPEYNFELLKMGAAGSDIWFHCPLKEREACGTSDQRAVINGNPVLTTKTGGAAEYIQEFNPVTGQGNGFFIEPYSPLTVYQKLKIVSDLYYRWQGLGDECWPTLRMNVFQTGKSLDISLMMQEYERQVFKPLLERS